MTATAAVLGIGLAASAFAAWEGPMPFEKYLDDFDREAARALYTVLPPTSSGTQEFALMPSSLVRGHVADFPDQPRVFVFFGGNARAERIECDRGSILRIAIHPNPDNRVLDVSNALSVGICGSQLSRIKAIARDAPASVRAQQAYVAMHSKANMARAEKAGLYFSERNLGAGLRAYHIPMLYPTQDTIAVENVVLVDNEGAWIVQAQLGTLCAKAREPRAGQAPSQHKLCTGTESVMIEMAKQLRSRFPK